MHVFRVTTYAGAIMVSLPNEIRKFATDPTFILPMMKLVEVVREKVQQAQAGVSDLGSFYEDAKAAFISSGLSPAKVDEDLWVLMGLYGARGASMDGYYLLSPKDPENTSVFANLGRVASLISYLDGATLPSGKPYSYPVGIKTSCDYTRPYHFWLSAYLTHRLLKDNYLPKDALAAIHGEEVVYEQFAGTAIVTKETMGNITSLNPHDYYIVETQKNIVFNDVGSFWNIATAKAAPVYIDLDSLFIDTYNASGKPAPSLSTSLLDFISPILYATTGYSSDTLFSWRKVIAPDVAENRLLQQLP
jgi:hypothetical protein